MRVLKFVKYLPRYGWWPLVIHAKYPIAPTTPKDETLLNDIGPEAGVYPTYSFELDIIIGVLFKPFILFVKFLNSVKLNGKSLGMALAWRLENVRDKILASFIPDKRIGWIPFAAAAAARSVKNKNVDVVISSGPPNSVHIAALMVKNISGKPWIADFRDPWNLESANKKNRIRQKLNNIIEKWVISKADKILTINEAIRKQIVDETSVDPRKIIVIPNGYDPDDFPKNQPRKSGPFRIIYSGGLTDIKPPDTLLKSIAKLKNENKTINPEIIKVIFIGKRGQERYKNMAEKLGVLDMVEFIGFLPHKQTCAMQASSDALLLLLDSQLIGNTFTTGKIYEYMYCRRPILAMIPHDSDAAIKLRENKTGIIVEPGDMEGMIKAIENMLEAYQDKRNTGNPTYPKIEQYSRIKLAGQLAGVLNSIEKDGG